MKCTIFFATSQTSPDIDDIQLVNRFITPYYITLILQKAYGIILFNPFT